MNDPYHFLVGPTESSTDTSKTIHQYCNLDHLRLTQQCNTGTDLPYYFFSSFRYPGNDI